MRQDYKDNLDFIVKSLGKSSQLFTDIAASSSSKDGRDVSKSGEDIVKDMIKTLSSSLPNPMKITYQLSRHWNDFLIDVIPVNIKITEGNCSDNAGSKLAVYVACTGYIPTSDPKMPNFAKMLKKGMKTPSSNIEDIDYVYLVFNKFTKHIHWIGARQLTILTPNGKNQPFQIDWSKNLSPTSRPISDAQKFLLKAYIESAKKASETVLLLDDVYNSVFIEKEIDDE